VIVAGRLVLDEQIAPGRLDIEDGVIAGIELDDAEAEGPYIAPGFVDLHVHGWGGHDAMGDRAALDGMARGLLRHGVTSFLPTAVSAPLGDLVSFAARFRAWRLEGPADGARPLGFNLEGPFLAAARRGAHAAAHLRAPSDVPLADLEGLVGGLRIVTVAPELPGALELIRWLADRGVVVSLGHSDASYEQARAGHAAGARSTTHLFNAMSGLGHRTPGLAGAALTADGVTVELIADGQHVDRALWPLVFRQKPPGRVILVSDAAPLGGTGDGRGWLGGLEVEVAGDRCVLVDGGALAGSVTALDAAVANVVGAGIPLPDALAAASRAPLALLGIVDRGRLEVGQVADLVELDDALTVRRVARAGVWLDVPSSAHGVLRSG
jgi:N-acetylglucosamine-6-phosphate deacetylase